LKYSKFIKKKQLLKKIVNFVNSITQL